MKDDKQNDRQGVALSDAASIINNAIAVAEVYSPDVDDLRIVTVRMDEARKICAALKSAQRGVSLSDDERGAISFCIDFIPDHDYVEILRRLLSRASSSRAEVERDAARYRRIRNGPYSDRHGDVYAMVFMPDGDTPIHGAKLDSITDAAMLAAAEAPNGDQS